MEYFEKFVKLVWIKQLHIPATCHRIAHVGFRLSWSSDGSSKRSSLWETSEKIILSEWTRKWSFVFLFIVEKWWSQKSVINKTWE